jgi:hypothetical protein
MAKVGMKMRKIKKAEDVVAYWTKETGIPFTKKKQEKEKRKATKKKMDNGETEEENEENAEIGNGKAEEDATKKAIFLLISILRL